MLPSVAADLSGDGLYGASFLAFLLSNLASLVAAGYWIDRVGVAEVGRFRPPQHEGVVSLMRFVGGPRHHTHRHV